MSQKYFDVLIVGAGLSGIGAAYHLQEKCPNRSYAILEARDCIGGTWDLFRYPGVRSDSDMYTLGYVFKPWTERKAIADGPAILKYVRETASENGIDKHIQFGLHVERASWSSDNGRWSVEAERENGDVVRFSCNFLFMCSGYYDYAGGHMPEFKDIDKYQGELVHPQQWPEDINYQGKKVVVIGSGATAVTLVPELAKDAAHVTMLQRSPTYMVSRPSVDRLALWLQKYLPAKIAYLITRWRNVLLGLYFFNYTRKNPKKVAAMLINQVRQHLGDDYDVRTHFTPRYNPWDQRLCLVPDGDMFEAIKSKRVSVVTDHIDRFTETGIKLQSGKELEADLVVSATGLKLQVLSGLQITVDGEKTELSKTLTYKGMMFSGVPNLALSMGYTNASWTLKCDLTCGYVCRLLNHMEKHEYVKCCAHNNDENIETVPFLDFTSGYVVRAMDEFPRQGTEKPWKLNQNYAKDMIALGFGSIEDAVMQFDRLDESSLGDRAPVKMGSG